MACVLIVDDDPLSLRLLQRLLQSEGYDLLTAQDALSALERLRRAPRPDLIISDIMMPGMLGTELVEYLAARTDLARIPVILISAYTDMARGAKTAAVVAKPSDPLALLKLVREVLADPNPPINNMREPRHLRS